MRKLNSEKQPDFLDSYEIEPYSGCWIFTRGEVTIHGYALLSRKFNREGVHRYFYRKLVGEIPHGQCVLHRCDTRLCVNPDHLFLGSKKDNYDDSRAKNRNTKGEIQGSSKLTEPKIVEIRNKYSRGSVKLKDLAADYGVHFSTIARIVNRNSWNHVA